MTDEEITKAAREICAAQADKQDNYEVYQRYLIGDYDHTIWMRLVEQGIRRGLKGQAMVKTQHCPNCEATEQKLHDFRQEVSDAVEGYFQPPNYLGKFNDTLGRFIIPKPKPDTLVEVMEDLGWYDADTDAENLRAALEARGLEIREKGNG
jgi:hypothetical protein